MVCSYRFAAYILQSSAFPTFSLFAIRYAATSMQLIAFATPLLFRIFAMRYLLFAICYSLSANKSKTILYRVVDPD
jgi:hypothetical protein